MGKSTKKHLIFEMGESTNDKAQEQVDHKWFLHMVSTAPPKSQLCPEFNTPQIRFGTCTILLKKKLIWTTEFIELIT
jgi:hypothetical protein